MRCLNLSTDNKKYYEQIDTLKGIAIFLVVLGHSIIVSPIDLHQNCVCDYLFRWLASVHMPLFFVISGYCYSFHNNYKKFVFKKILRLVIPYFVFNIIDLIPRMLLPDLVNRSRSIGESIKCIFLYGGEYWFLYVLFLIFLLFPFLDKLLSKSRILTCLIMITGVFLFYLIDEIEFLCISRIVYYLFYFIIGNQIKKSEINIFDYKKFSSKSISFLLVMLFPFWLTMVYLDIEYISVFVAIIGIFSFYLLSNYKVINKIFSRFGKYSLQLYLLNGFFLVFSRTIIVTKLEFSNPIIIISFNMLVDFFVSYLFIKYICDKAKISKLLMGL